MLPSPVRLHFGRSLVIASAILVGLLFGCRRVGTTRLPLKGRVPGVGVLWQKSVSTSARADLEYRRLRLEFATHPRQVFQALEAETLIQPSPHGFLVLGEIAYRIGQKKAVFAPRESLEWFRDAAVYASFVVPDIAIGSEAMELHNRAVLQCLHKANSHDRRADTLRENFAIAGMTLGTADPDLDPALFDRIEAASDQSVEGLTRHTIDGLGVPLLAVRELPERQSRTGRDRVYAKRLVPPLTALLLSEGSTTNWRNQPIRLVVFDPIRHANVAIGGRNLPLAADFTTPLAYQAEGMRASGLEIAGAANPEKLDEKTGIYLIHPHQPGKIPVLFVHGLVSSPGAWVPMFNELRADPVLRNHYEFWFAYYPTGFPTPISVAKLRTELHKVQQELDPLGTDPAMQNMVVVGHSMGGLVSRMLIQSSGDTVWNSYFTRPREQVVMSDEGKSWANRVFYFEPEPAIRRVVFIATPHRGSTVANQLFGRFSSLLVRRSSHIRELREQVASANGMEVFQPEYRNRMMSSIDNLERDSPILKTLATLPLAPGVPYHSIVGDISRRGDPNRWTDGIVNYESAHFDGAESEIMVPYFHTSCTSKPEPITEVRRILQLHIGNRVE